MTKALAIALFAALSVGPPAVERSASGIEGRVLMKERKLQRVANPYAGAGASAAHAVKELPAIVFLSGAIGGKPETPERPLMAQRDTSFQPELIIIPVGTTVSFPNQDGFFHNVFSYSKAKRFDLGRYPKGEAKNVTFDEPGTISVLCEIHKWMRGAIVVVENKHHAVVKADGSFSLPDVPPGSYKLTVWHVERGTRTIDVTVPAAGSARVDVSF
jgi:plastocyanin